MGLGNMVVASKVARNKKATDAIKGVLLPGVAINEERQTAIKDAQDSQNRAITSAEGYQQQNFDYIKGQNEPIIKIGDQYLDLLRQGVESGAFDMNESMFRGYQQYVVPQYQQGGKFEGMPRENIITPEKYQYNQQRAADPNFNNYNQDESGKPTLGQTQSFEQYFPDGQNQQPGRMASPGTAPGYMNDNSQPFAGNANETFDQQRKSANTFQSRDAEQYYSPDKFQYDQQRQDVSPFNAQQASQYDAPGQFQYGQARPGYQEANTPQWNDNAFTGQQYMENYDQYQGQNTPQARRVSDRFQTQMYRPDGERPDNYRAENAPDAQYYDPNKEQYKSKEFKLENDPVYQRRLEQSGQAIEDSAARQGMQLSGANLKALQENAQGLAAEEGSAAWNRYQQDDQQGYSRFMDKQNASKDAMRFNSADEYARYLDNSGIRKEEQGQLIAQWEDDRQFGASQNKEGFLREQASKDLGRNLNEDEYQRWLDTDGQKYNQFADQRDWTTGQSNMNAARDWEQYTYEKGFGRDVYSDDRNNAQQQAQQRNAYNTDAYNTDRNFAYQSSRDNVDDRLNAYNINNANRMNDRDFGYGQNQDQQNRNDTRYQQDRGFAYQSSRDNINDRLDTYNINNTNRIDDRNFGYQANQNTQDRYDNRYSEDYSNFLANKGMNFDQNLSTYNANNANRIDQRNFTNDQYRQMYQDQLSAYDRNAGQYKDNRGFAYGQQQDQFGNNLNSFNALQGQYQSGQANSMAGDQMNFDRQFSTWNAKNQNFKFDRQYGADQNQQNFQNTFNVWDANNQNKTIDNQMGYDAWNQGNQNNMNMYQYGTNLGYQMNRDQYNNITDKYNRDAANRKNKYTSLGDLMKVGMEGRTNLGNAMGVYSDSMSDLSLQRGNAAAAAEAARVANSGIIKKLGF